jgi:muramoyltetrapeptide carboxypeptidase LdcA involved in peptidoglycan recycling
VEALQRLRGTPFFPETRGAILALETASDEPNVSYLESVLTDYRNMGILGNIVGLIFGRKHWPKESTQELCDLLGRMTSGNPVPTLVGLDFGHISPIATIPLGAGAKLNSDTAELTVHLRN